MYKIIAAQNHRINQSYDSYIKHYFAGLAYQGLENKNMAKKEFEKALTYNPSHIWSQVHLKQIE